MKRRTNIPNRPPITTTFVVPDETKVTRKQRLLVIALQLPQIDNLFRKTSQRKHQQILRDRFQVWKEYLDRIKRIPVAVIEKRKVFSAVLIQSVVRMYVERRRILKVKIQIQAQYQAKRQLQNEKATKLQCLIRRFLAVKRVFRLKQAKELKRLNAIITIQRVFRGMLGRGIILLIEKRKLLKFIRTWSKGVSQNLFHISGEYFLLFSPLMFPALLITLPYSLTGN
jgi:hypothetical protein